MMGMRGWEIPGHAINRKQTPTAHASNSDCRAGFCVSLARRIGRSLTHLSETDSFVIRHFGMSIMQVVAHVVQFSRGTDRISATTSWISGHCGRRCWSRTRSSCQRRLWLRCHQDPVDQLSLDCRPREFSSVQLDEVVHADRLLACELEQIIGHTVVAALLVQVRHHREVLDDVCRHARL